MLKIKRDKNLFKNKTILITGGTGTFGQNFTKYLLKNYSPRKIIIFSRDEFKQFYMKQEFNEDRLRFFIGDVRDLPRLDTAFKDVDIVIHAAALKQVPSIEYNPFEAVKTNIIGSQNVIEAAISRKIPKVVLISSDKAVHPINLYGATKLAAEKLFVSGNSYSPWTSSFCAVRYGNVFGSRGSIIEVLLKNKTNKKIQITDSEMTRFWITLERAFELVTFALKNMEGGEIFVPKIPSMKLLDLFRAVAPEAKQKVIGVRPGEKLHEILLTEDEARRSFSIGGYYIVLPEFIFKKGSFKKYARIGKRLAKNFRFTSDNNTDWISPDQLNKFIADLSK